jgi:hypothetical protein
VTRDPVISFFMIVTDRDCVIADYAVRSYATLQDVPFRLVIYSNWVLEELRERYFPRWRRLPYVEIVENPAHTDELKPKDAALWGPFELGYAIWDRELPRLTGTPFHAVVDADFEILDPRFVKPMIDRLAADDRLIGMAADHSPTTTGRYDSYTGRVIELVERWHTHFLVYKRAALECGVSYRARVELSSDGTHRRVWDDHAYFQQTLREVHGLRLDAVDPEYRRCYVHYGAFGHNRHITPQNVELYRRIQIFKRHGAFRRGDPVTRAVGGVADWLFFGRVDRRTYVPGWGRSEYAEVIQR